MSYAQNPLVPWLLSHSYGQGGTVAVPAVDTASVGMPRGQYPAGIQEVLDHVSSLYNSWTAASTQVDWVFLVGGPGNGKSEALRSLASVLGIALPARVTGQPVPRAVPAAWPASVEQIRSGLDVAFVNDASIPRSGVTGGAGSLFLDIKDALTRIGTSHRATALFANVNRGILVEEATKIASLPAARLEESLARLAVNWLASPPPETTGTPATVPTLVTTVATSPGAPQYGQFHLLLPTGATPARVVVHVVFLDSLSLLEPAPGAGSAAVDLSTVPPTVAPYSTIGSLVSSDVPRTTTTAGRLLSEFVQPTRWNTGGCVAPDGTPCEAHGSCPFAQNAGWLQDDTLRSRYLDALRGAEVAAGRRLTYRDLLGHVSLTVLGRPEEAWLKQNHHPCDWVAEQHRQLQGGNKATVVALASHRVYSNLFVAGGDEAPPRRLPPRESDGPTVFGAIKARAMDLGDSPRVRAFERAFHDVDPARDTDAWGGVRTRAIDAVEAIDVHAPSASLVARNDLSRAAHSDIEVVLDQVLREELAREHERGDRTAASRARFLRRWRAIALLRQVGLATGRLSNGDAIQAWLSEHENALRRGSRMPLGDGIHNLVLPRGTSAGGQVFLAPLRPRTHPITADLPASTLLVPLAMGDLALVIVAEGDTMLAEVQASRSRERQPPLTLARLVVDLAVAREAMLHATGDMRSFTEIGYTAFARIERARASLVSRRQARAIQVHFTDDAGNMHRIVTSPGGQAPLRVQRGGQEVRR